MATTIGQAYVQILPSAKGIGSNIQAELNKEVGSAGERAGGSLASGLGKKLIAGIGALGIGAAIGKALSEGGKLQQSYGGLETLYGDAAAKAREYAAAAAQAGVSQNEYAEQAVSFGAALKQAYGGDTTQAVEAANTAIMDMTDNAAKMGTPLESIQNAYQGFAKQNYTMLDNLKLGYGGTKEEMERLLSDAEELTGKEYNIDNLGDVYEAIHAVQGELGLTGVAAEEASTTFEGSFNAMKASVSNLLGNLMLGEDVGPSMKALADSMCTFLFDNLAPALENIFQNLPAMLGTFLEAGVPKLAAGVSSLVNGISSYLSKNHQKILNAITKISIKAAKFIEKNLPKFLAAAVKLGTQLAKGFIKSLPTILAAIGRVAASIGKSLLKGLNKAAASALNSVIAKIKAVWSKVKATLTKPIESAKTAIKGIVEKIKGFFNFKLPTPHVKVPYFTIEPPGWKLSDLLEGVIPSLHTGWHAKGGFVNKAQLIGVGEAGPEAILPLDPFWKRMDDMADSMQGGNTFNVTMTATAQENPEQFAQRTIREMHRLVRMGAI